MLGWHSPIPSPGLDHHFVHRGMLSVGWGDGEVGRWGERGSRDVGTSMGTGGACAKAGSARHEVDAEPPIPPSPHPPIMSRNPAWLLDGRNDDRRASLRFVPAGLRLLAGCMGLSLLLLLAFSRIAGAQAGPGFEDVSVPRVAQSSAASQVGDRFLGLVTPQPLENVKLLWSLHRSLRARDNREGALDKLAALQELRKDFGWAALPEISSALAVQAAGRVEEGRRQEARYLAGWSVRLSPQEPGARLAAARVALLSGFYPVELLSSLGSWLRLSLSDPLHRRRLLSELVLLIVPALLLAILTGLLAAWFRTRRLLVHDLGHVLFRGAGRGQRSALAVLLLGLAVLAPLGAFGVMLGWSLLVWMRLGIAERAAVVAGLVLLILSPHLARLLDRQVTQLHGVRAAAYRLQYHGPSTDDLAQLADAVERCPDDLVLRYTQALVDKRTGRLYSAARHLKVVLDRDPEHRQGLLLLAIIDLALHRPAMARETLAKLLRRWPGSAAARFDMYRIAQVMNTPGLSQHLVYAQQLDEERTDAFLEDESACLNRFLMDENLPVSEILDNGRGAQDEGSSRFLAAVAPWLWGTLPPRLGPLMAGGAILLLLVLWVAARRMPLSHACVECGQPLCHRCHPLVGRTRHCEACTPGFALLDGEALVSSAVFDRMRQEARYRRGRMAAALSALIPGAGLVVYGRTALAAALMVAWYLVLLRALLSGGVFRSRLPWGAFSDLMEMAALGALALVVWLLGQLLVRRCADQRWEP